ncbi:hypothetical protein IKQ21_08275, partial [bacterium]|nr:hypothetical protein [bacterium]
MPEVQNVGAADYAMPVQQNQYATEPIADENVPMVYDPEIEAKKKSASAGVGLTLLGLMIAAGLGIWGGKALGSRGKAEAEKSVEQMKEVMKDINKGADKVVDNTFGGFRFGQEYARSVKEKTKPFIEEAE